MHRRIISTCVALLALGVLTVAPAVSSAHTATDAAGKVAVGSKIVGYNVNGTAPELVAAFNIQCSETVLTGSVHANPAADGSVQGTIEDAWFQGNTVDTAANNTPTQCLNTSTGGVATIKTNLTGGPHVGTSNHWCIRTIPGTDEFETTPRNCTSAEGGAFTFSVATSGLTCGFTRAAAIKGTFTTTAAGVPGVLKMTNNQVFTTDAVAGHSVFCPANGELRNFEFNLYTDTTSTPAAGAEHVWRDAASVADPIWIDP